MCRDDRQKELIVLKILHILKDWKILICFRLREGCSELTSSNAGKYSTVNVGYVRRIYLLLLGAVLFVVTVIKSLMIFFQRIVGGGHLLGELYLPGIPYETMLLLLKLWGVLRGPFDGAWIKNCFISVSLFLWDILFVWLFICLICWLFVWLLLFECSVIFIFLNLNFTQFSCLWVYLFCLLVD